MTPTPQRVALVTGAARGIGAAVVRHLADHGWAVLALDACAGPDATPYPMPTPNDLANVAAGREHVLTTLADVRDPTSLQAAVDHARERWGRLDVAVAAAAVIAGGQPLWQTPDDALDLLWDVDVKGVWNTARATVPAMLAGPDPHGCRFIAVSSAAGSHGLFHLAGYNAAKHAVNGMVRGLAADLVGTGVAAIAVAPGSTRTDMLTQTAALYDVTTDDLAQHQLTKRLLEPDEIADVITMCAGTAGAALNGSIVHADGGFQP